METFSASSIKFALYFCSLNVFLSYCLMLMDFGFHWIGVQKERMLEEDMYVLSPTGSILSEPLAKPYPHKPPKCSDCGPLFMKVYSLVLYRRRNFVQCSSCCSSR